MTVPAPSEKWPPVQRASRNSGRGFGGNWVYLGVATAVTLLVVWSIWGPLTASLQPPPTCACAILVPARPSPLPVILAVFGLFLFYFILFFVKFARDAGR